MPSGDSLPPASAVTQELFSSSTITSHKMDYNHSSTESYLTPHIKVLQASPLSAPRQPKIKEEMRSSLPQSELELRTCGPRIFFFERAKNICHTLERALQTEWIYPHMVEGYKHIIGYLKQGESPEEWNDALEKSPLYAEISGSHYQVMRFETVGVPTIWARPNLGGPEVGLRWDEANGYWLNMNCDLEVEYCGEDLDIAVESHIPQSIIEIFENPVVVVQESTKEKAEQEIKQIFKTSIARKLVILNCNMEKDINSQSRTVEKWVEDLDPDEHSIFFMNPMKYKNLIHRCVESGYYVLVTSVPGIENWLPVDFVWYSPSSALPV